LIHHPVEFEMESFLFFIAAVTLSASFGSVDGKEKPPGCPNIPANMFNNQMVEPHMWFNEANGEIKSPTPQWGRVWGHESGFMKPGEVWTIAALCRSTDGNMHEYGYAEAGGWMQFLCPANQLNYDFVTSTATIPEVSRLEFEHRDGGWNGGSVYLKDIYLAKGDFRHVDPRCIFPDFVIPKPEGYVPQTFVNADSSNAVDTGKIVSLESGEAGDFEKHVVVTADGTLADDPSVAYNHQDLQYLVVWRGDHPKGGIGKYEIYGRLFDAFQTTQDVSASKEVKQISTVGESSDIKREAGRPDVTYNSEYHEYLVVWSGEHNEESKFEIYGQRLNQKANALKENFPISNVETGDLAHRSFRPVVTYSIPRQEYFVVWYGDTKNAVGVMNIFGVRLGPSGSRRGDVILIGDDPKSHDPTVLFNPVKSQYFIAYVCRSSQIFARRITDTGNTIGARGFRLNTDERKSYAPSVAFNTDDQQYLVTWTEHHENNSNKTEVWGVQLESDATLINGQYRISFYADAPSPFKTALPQYPVSVYDDFHHLFFVAWVTDLSQSWKIHGRCVDHNGNPLRDMAHSFRLRMQDVSVPGSQPKMPAIVYNGHGVIFLVWTASDPDNKGALYAQTLIFDEPPELARQLPQDLIAKKDVEPSPLPPPSKQPPPPPPTRPAQVPPPSRPEQKAPVKTEPARAPSRVAPVPSRNRVYQAKPSPSPINQHEVKSTVYESDGTTTTTTVITVEEDSEDSSDFGFNETPEQDPEVIFGRGGGSSATTPSKASSGTKASVSSDEKKSSNLVYIIAAFVLVVIFVGLFIRFKQRFMRSSSMVSMPDVYNEDGTIYKYQDDGL